MIPAANVALPYASRVLAGTAVTIRWPMSDAAPAFGAGP